MTGTGTGGELLVVEDDPNDLELTLRAFRRSHLVSPVEAVRDGAEALEYLFQTGRYAGLAGRPRPRVVLLDLKLPLVDGIDVLRAVKADPDLRHVPVVVLTSSGQDRDLRTCYELGANSYIVKPVDMEQFFHAVADVQLYWMLLNQRP